MLPAELEQCYLLLCKKPECFLLYKRTECYLVSWRSCVSEAVGGMLVLYKMASWSKLHKELHAHCVSAAGLDWR